METYHVPTVYWQITTYQNRYAGIAQDKVMLWAVVLDVTHPIVPTLVSSTSSAAQAIITVLTAIGNVQETFPGDVKYPVPHCLPANGNGIKSFCTIIPVYDFAPGKFWLSDYHLFRQVCIYFRDAVRNTYYRTICRKRYGVCNGTVIPNWAINLFSYPLLKALSSPW